MNMVLITFINQIVMRSLDQREANIVRITYRIDALTFWQATVNGARTEHEKRAIIFIKLHHRKVVCYVHRRHFQCAFCAFGVAYSLR